MVVCSRLQLLPSFFCSPGTPEWIFTWPALQKIAQIKFRFIHKQIIIIRNLRPALGLAGQGWPGLPCSGVSVLNGVAQDLGADFGANTTFITAAEITRT